MVLRTLGVLLVVLAACGNDDAHRLADAPPGHDDAPLGGEAPAPIDSPDVIIDHDSTLLVTQSPAGPSNGNPSTWGGILQFQITGDGGALVSGAGVGSAGTPQRQQRAMPVTLTSSTRCHVASAVVGGYPSAPGGVAAGL